MRKKIDQKTFNAVKIMTAGGASIKEIGEYLELSSSVINRIRSAETWQEYLNILAAMAAAQKEKYHKPKKETKPAPLPEKPVQPVQPSANTYYVNNQLLQAIKEQNELLKLISAKMAFIVEQLA